MLLYIDPGTGSMLFTVLLGLIGAAVYSLRMLFIKLRFAISGGKAKERSLWRSFPMTSATGLSSPPFAGNWISGAYLCFT